MYYSALIEESIYPFLLCQTGFVAKQYKYKTKSSFPSSLEHVQKCSFWRNTLHDFFCDKTQANRLIFYTSELQTAQKRSIPIIKGQLWLNDRNSKEAIMTLRYQKEIQHSTFLGGYQVNQWVGILSTGFFSELSFLMLLSKTQNKCFFPNSARHNNG